MRWLVFIIMLWALPAQAQQLKPYKDKLFAYPPTIHLSKDGSFRFVNFNKQISVHQRDEIPLRRVKRQYVNERLRWQRRLSSYTSPNGTFKHYEVGKARGAAVTVVYVHGKGGNHRQGVNDWTFGGNFNRLQNLMANNNGLLLTPSFSDFQDKGTQDIKALISRYAPHKNLIVACGSMGGGVCWRLAADPQIAQQLAGLFILGSYWNEAYLQGPAFAAKVPLYMGHGTDDVVFSPKKQLDFFNSIQRKSPGYPGRFVLYDSGVHGTPIRMVNWRDEINWMLRQ
ncbi:MAG: alpha/beta hydrolase [Pseudomonadota bacterium]